MGIHFVDACTRSKSLLALLGYCVVVGEGDDLFRPEPSFESSDQFIIL